MKNILNTLKRATTPGNDLNDKANLIMGLVFSAAMFGLITSTLI